MVKIAAPTLTACELEMLRDTSEAWMPDKLDIYNVTVTDDPYGGSSSTEVIDVVEQDVPCDVQSGVAQEQDRVVAAKITETQLFQVTVPALTTINVGDHITIYTTVPSMHLIVQAVFAPESWEVERRVLASKEVVG